ncbi:type I-E CRISPR-associated protein Cas7/Cse4/CasC [Methylobacterium frigidaeris]|uniref:CRISPR system Cascade subunit CasC n=3 Tax=Methylobacterium frigidaeris TaxID=2038277 RepID=A0AA37M7S0_9HYPH|nr:type I-E CRISPR-associated protein Cas7/Cse4/CasC [Methylobacterium frigidaeris]GJD65407.1 CRISPR system Cascade subunit CasC [Methylobacterium frigidaeris]
MTTFVQLHLLTAYPPANLNRDDTGRPKTARLGNVDRLRVSSQALKRAWRTSPAFKAALEGHLGERTQRLGEEIEGHLLKRGVAEAAARKAARDVADVFGKVKGEGDKYPTRIEQLVFVSAEERADALALAERIAAGESIDLSKTPLLRSVDGAVDIGMFGRMLADDPDFNREAAVQVAHAVTTHRAVVEDDYYTAIDDLKTPAEDAGAGFVGEAGFGAGTFYLYLCIDRDLLTRNLGGDAELARRGLAALIHAATTVGPKGKQASFASRALASYGLVEVSNGAPHTLAAAFLKPVGGEDVLAGSIAAFEATRNGFRAAYDLPESRRDKNPEGWRGNDAAWPVYNTLTGEGSLKRLIAYATR